MTSKETAAEYVYVPISVSDEIPPFNQQVYCLSDGYPMGEFNYPGINSWHAAIDDHRLTHWLKKVPANSLQPKEADKDREIERLKDEIQSLKDWKESACLVMPDFQEIGKMLNVPLGEQVSPYIIPKIKALQENQQDREAEGMKWVSVKDRLPSPNTWVIGYFSDIAMSGEVLYDEDGEFITNSGKSADKEITHWMPLPASPSIGSTTQAEDGLKNFIKSQKYPSGEEMDVLNKTFSRLRSDKPTRLKEEDVEKMEGKLIESLNKWIVGCENMGYDIDFIETRLVNICSDHQLNLSR